MMHELMENNKYIVNIKKIFQKMFKNLALLDGAGIAYI